MATIAAPETVTIRNTTGVYDLNKTLSDSTANLLYMQNVSWIVRQAVAWSAIQLTLKQTEEDGVSKIEQHQRSTGGQHNEEHWIIDGESRPKESRIFGAVEGYHKFSKLSDVKDEWLTEGWEEVDGEIIEAKQSSEINGWQVHQVIGFAVIDDVRRHVRRIIGTKGEQVEKVRMIYDYTGPVDENVETGEDGPSSLPQDAMPDV